MRALFGVLGLLVVLAIVGMLAKTQLKGVSETKVPVAPVGSPTDQTTPAQVPINPDGNVAQQSQQIQQQYKAMAEAAVQTPRPMPDDK